MEVQIGHRKKPSFSSSLLDAVYRSIDEPEDSKPPLPRCCFEQELDSLCRDIRVEKWIQTHFASTLPSHNRKPPTAAGQLSALKKVKEPNSPSARIVSFLNAIFAPRNSRKASATTAVTKSRSMKEDATTPSRRCLRKNSSVSCRDKHAKWRSLNRFCVNVGFHKLGGEYDDRSSCSSSELFELDSLRRGMAPAELRSIEPPPS